MNGGRGRPKLTPEQVVQIHEMRAAGAKLRTIATRFGVTDTAISLRLKQPRPVLAPVPAPASVVRWRVERDRNETQYLRGWTACDSNGNGAWFPTWSQAWRFALTRAHTTRSECVTIRTAEQVDMLQTAFPWSSSLTPEERSRFAAELVERHGTDVDEFIADWHAAAIYANRGLMKAASRSRAS